MYRFSSVFNPPPSLPDDLIAQNLSQLQRLPVAKGLLFQLIGEVGVTVAPAIFGGTGFHRFSLGVASPNDVGLDLTLYLVYMLSQFSFPPVFSFVFCKSDPFAGEFSNKRPIHQFSRIDVLIICKSIVFTAS